MELRRARFSVLMITLWVAASVAVTHAATVQIQNPDGGLDGSKVKDNGKLVGVVGDFVSLEPGEHQLRIGAPRDYTLIVSLRVSENSVTVNDAQTSPGNCKESYETRWNAPTIAKLDNKRLSNKPSRPPLSFLLIETPQFGAPSKRGPCHEDMYLSCSKSMAIVTVDSTPPGAEIWVSDGRGGDERMNVPTPAKLSVTFCPRTEHEKTFLIRIPGRTTCTRRLPVAEGVVTKVECDLGAPM
jgi:hypothetical protein